MNRSSRKFIFVLLIIVITAISTMTFTETVFACSSDPMLGSICYVGFTFCPRGYANADGQLLDISSNTALFALLGTTYGGDGRTTFGLPDLRGRVPVHVGNGPGLSSYTQGSIGGDENVALTVNQMPVHDHDATLWASSANASENTPGNHTLASKKKLYGTDAVDVTMAPSIGVEDTGGSQSHENRPPYLTLRACIALVGIFPSTD